MALGRKGQKKGRRREDEEKGKSSELLRRRPFQVPAPPRGTDRDADRERKGEREQRAAEQKEEARRSVAPWDTSTVGTLP